MTDTLQVFWVRDPDYRDDGIAIDMADAYYAAYDASHAYEMWINSLDEDMLADVPESIHVWRMMSLVEPGLVDWAIVKRFYPRKGEPT